MNGEMTLQVGVVLDETVELTLGEISHACQVHTEAVVQLVEAGVLEPQGAHPGEWRFPGPSLRRAERALRLQRDLEIGPSAVALVLDLLEENDRLRARIRVLEGEG